jgi:outer membrane protein OmpA-like peptidoglycan-associated protein
MAKPSNAEASVFDRQIQFRIRRWATRAYRRAASYSGEAAPTPLAGIAEEVPDLPELSDSTKRKLAVQWDALLDRHRPTGTSVDWYASASEQIRRNAGEKVPNGWGPWYGPWLAKHESAKRRPGITPSVEVAKERFAAFSGEYWRLWEASGAGYETYAGQQKKQPVEGHVSYAPPIGVLPVIRNRQNAIRSAGGQILCENGEGGDPTTAIGPVKGGSEAWLTLRAWADGGVCHIVIVAKQAMRQEAAIDGIDSDAGKWELKLESEAALVEIARLPAENPALEVYVPGNTDMVADPSTEVRLPQARAQAVVNAPVTKHGARCAGGV